MNKYLKVVLIILGICVTTSTVKAETVLPKEDAAMMFGMTFIQWRQNVLAAEQAGFAQSDSLRPLELTMIADVPNGRVITTPSYKSEDAFPWKISVAVLLDPSALQVFLTQQRSDFERFIENVYEEMRPEYTVMTSLMLPAPNGLVLQDFQVFRAGEFPVLDITAETKRGCWQECIIKP